MNGGQGHQRGLLRTGRLGRAVCGELSKSPAGFSLVELMVVISIVSILMVIGTMGVLAVHKTNAVHKTRATLSVLKAIADEYEAQAGTIINHDTPPSAPFDWGASQLRNASTAIGSGTVDDEIERFVWATNQLPLTAKMLRTLGGDVWVDDVTGVANKFGDRDGFNEIVDGWGRKLMYRDTNTVNPAPPELQLRIYNHPFFVSAGPDGNFGDESAAAGSSDKNKTLDNIYSFDQD